MSVDVLYIIAALFVLPELLTASNTIINIGGVLIVYKMVELVIKVYKEMRNEKNK